MYVCMYVWNVLTKFCRKYSIIMQRLVTECHNIVNILRCWHIRLCNFFSFVIIPRVNPENKKPETKQKLYDNPKSASHTMTCASNPRDKCLLTSAPKPKLILVIIFKKNE